MTDFRLHKPTGESREAVRSLASFGVSREEIAKYIKIDPDTLVKYYSDILDTAKTNANRNIAEMLYQKALKGDTTCMIFWLKTQAKFREVDKAVEKPIHESILEILQSLKTVQGLERKEILKVEKLGNRLLEGEKLYEYNTGRIIADKEKQ
jgi:hypothetical protein